MKNHQTLANLEKTLANSYLLMLKTQNYHWNVVGQNFKSLHELFASQYEDLFTAIDEIAERIRSFGSKVEGTFENFSKLGEVKNANKNFDDVAMIKDLIASNEIVLKQLHHGIKAAQSEGDEGTADLLIQRSKIHEKAIWMLSSSLPVA